MEHSCDFIEEVNVIASICIYSVKFITSEAIIHVKICMSFKGSDFLAN